jgi:hypothetical protein
VPILGQEAKQGAEPKNNSQSKQTPTKQITSPIANPTTAPNPQEKRPKEKSDDREVTISTVKPVYVRADIQKDWMDKLNWALGAALVVVAAIGVCIGINSLHAARDSARAALLNAQAVMAAERAWITVLPYIWSPDLYPLWETGDPVPASGMMNPIIHSFPAKIRNVGRTPAKIDQIGTRYVHLQDHPTFLPAEPDYGKLENQHGYLLISDDEIMVNAHLSSNSGFLTKRAVSDIRNGVSYLYAFGVVKYRDTYDGPHETRFGFIYHFPQGGMINFEKAAFRKVSVRRRPS